MSFFKKLFAVGSTVAMLAAGALVPSAALAAAHGAGSVVKTPDGTVWFITSDNQRRAFTSGGAFMTYGFLSFAQVVDANSDDTALQAGSFIAPRDGSIFCATSTKGTDVAGECALITGGMKAAFTSAAVFTGQGYSFARAQYGDSSFLSKTSNIDNAGAAHRQGTLVNMSGTVYLVGTSTLLGIPSTDVFNSWGYSFADVVPANAADMSMTKSGVMCARVAGMLNPSFTAGSCSDDNGNDDGGPLDGGVGSIEVSAKSTYNNEEVGEDDEDAPVLAFEVEAGDDSDVRLTSMKLEIKQTNTADSQDITDYIDEVSIWNGDEKLGSSDADSFSEDNDIYTRSISLSGDGAIVRAGETETFVVAVTAQGNLDSGDIDSDAFAADVLNIRFEDGDEVVTTEDTDADTLDRSFNFASFAAANDVEVKVALNEDDDDINEAHVIDVDDNDDTNSEEILSFTIEADGNSDITIHDIPVNVDVTGAANVDDMITDIVLVNGDNEYTADTFGAGVGADETYTFSDIDLDIDAGETEEFMVKVDFKSTSDVDLDNGDTISAQLSSTEVDAIDAEDESGEDISTADLTGTAIGEASVVYDTGIMTEFVTSSARETFIADDAGEFDQGEFKITFTVTAFDGDMRIDRSCEEGGADAAGQGVEYTITNSGSNSTTCVLTSSSTDTEDTANTFEVDEDTTRTFTLTVNATASADAFAQVALESINWGTATNDTNANYYTFDLGDYKTDAISLDAL